MTRTDAVPGFQNGWPALPPHLRQLWQRLPTLPPSWALSQALNRWLWPQMDVAQRAALQGGIVEVEVVELGLRVRLVLGPQGFAAAGDAGAPKLRLRARADALWRLLRGEDDADRLFFERGLTPEGDTEFGLILKNTLDAIGPLWNRS